MGREAIGIDTSIFVYFFQENREYFKKARNVLKTVEEGRVVGVFSAIGMIELLTGLKKREKYDLAFQYKAALSTFPHLSIRGINEHVVDVASDIRATYGVATPDAIHLATAIDFGAKKFITNDKRLRKVKEIAVELL